MRSLTLRSMFSTSLSAVSFNSDDWAPSVSTTLGYNALALWGRGEWWWCGGVGGLSIRSQQPGAAVKEAGCSHHRVHLNGPACESFLPVSCFLLPVLMVSSSPSLPDCYSRGAEPPAVTGPEGQPASFIKKRGKENKRRSENQFLIKLICKGCIKRCSTFALAQLSVWCDLEYAMHCLTNSVHACWRRRCYFCLTRDW